MRGELPDEIPWRLACWHNQRGVLGDCIEHGAGDSDDVGQPLLTLSIVRPDISVGRDVYHKHSSIRRLSPSAKLAWETGSVRILNPGQFGSHYMDPDGWRIRDFNALTLAGPVRR